MRGHEWCEVVLEDRWMAVDPTWNQFPVDATHLRLSDEAAIGGARADFTLEVVEIVTG